MNDIEETLKERGKQYGEFHMHAHISQKLKDVMHEFGEDLTPLHYEALEMIFHKIARILNGNPNYEDSWHDIAGYAKLVEDRLAQLRITVSDAQDE